MIFLQKQPVHLGNSGNGNNERAPIQFRNNSNILKNDFFPKNRLIHFYMNSISIISLIKQIKFSFSSIEINGFCIQWQIVAKFQKMF